MRHLVHHRRATRFVSAHAAFLSLCLIPFCSAILRAQECRAPGADTLRTILFATLRTVPGDISADNKQLALQELVGLLPPPSQLPIAAALDVDGAFLDTATAKRMLVISSGIAFTVDPNGRARDASLLADMRTPAGAKVDALLQLLVRKADSARVLGGLFLGSAADTARLELRLTALPAPDDIKQPFVRVAIAYGRADLRAEPSPNNPAPRYPQSALEQKLGDTVRVRFVVDERGRPESGSIGILRASRQEFSDAVVYVLPYHRFQPAFAGSCAVRSLRVMDFTFGAGKVMSEVVLDADPSALETRQMLGAAGDGDNVVPDNSGGVLNKLVMDGPEQSSLVTTSTRMPVVRSTCSEQAERAPPDSVTGKIVASLRATRGGRIDDRRLVSALEALLPHLPSGETFPFPVDSSGVAWHSALRQATAENLIVPGAVTFKVHPDGRLVELKPVYKFGSIRMISAITRTLRAADSARTLARIVAPGQPVELQLTVGTRAVSGGVSRQLFEFVMAYRTETPAMARDGNRAPRYPHDLQARGADGDVLVQFVVDTTGIADMRTFKVLRSTDHQFSLAVANVIPTYRFYPAQLGSCKVRMYVQMPFAFRMNRESPLSPLPDPSTMYPRFPGSRP